MASGNPFRPSTIKIDGHLGRNFLEGRDGDHANAVLTAVGYNFRLILNWLRLFLCRILDFVLAALFSKAFGNAVCKRATH